MSSEIELDPEKLIGGIGIVVGLAIIFIRWFLGLLRHVPADPWSPEIDQAVRKRDAVPVCVECLCPQEGHRWFCPHCGFPSGEYVTTMPYLYIFTYGELLRRGVTGPPDKSSGRFLGFAVFSAAQYSLFFPVYWFWLIRKACGKPIGQPSRPDLKFVDPDSDSSGADDWSISSAPS